MKKESLAECVAATQAVQGMGRASQMFLHVWWRLGGPHSIRFQAARVADYVFYFGEVVFFLRRRERDGRVEACDADDGAVEIVEGFFVDDGGDFAGEASGAGVFVEDDDFVRLLYCCCDGFAI